MIIIQWYKSIDSGFWFISVTQILHLDSFSINSVGYISSTRRPVSEFWVSFWIIQNDRFKRIEPLFLDEYHNVIQTIAHFLNNRPASLQIISAYLQKNIKNTNKNVTFSICHSGALSICHSTVPSLYLSFCCCIHRSVSLSLSLHHFFTLSIILLLYLVLWLYRSIYLLLYHYVAISITLVALPFHGFIYRSVTLSIALSVHLSVVPSLCCSIT